MGSLVQWTVQVPPSNDEMPGCIIGCICRLPQEPVHPASSPSKVILETPVDDGAFQMVVDLFDA